jgi:hypothetical protein
MKYKLTQPYSNNFDIFAWSYEEMPGIDPNIVIHEIKTYPEAKPVRKSFHPHSSTKSCCY